MSNGICQRQNEEDSITLLAAQRQLYSEAKLADDLYTLLMVMVPFSLSIIKLYIQSNTALTSILYVLSIVSLFVGLLFKNYVEQKKEIASIIQQQFDTYIFKMPWDKRLFEQKKNLYTEIAIKSDKLLMNPTEKNDLYNWYEAITDEISLNEGILCCQKESICWDKLLRKRYRDSFIIIIVIMVSIVSINGIIRNESVEQLLYSMAFVAPLVYWLYETTKTINSDIKRLNKIYDKISENNIKTMDDLQEIQRDILEHRKSCYAIPNFTYIKLKNKIKKIIHRSAELDKKIT